jgi:CheY-like chemotaxis protein/anti-sigma regulatory factor (Ser/Thr protein kinase)
VHILTRRGAPPETLKGLEAIDRNVKAQARIISDILDVSRINSGKLRLDRQWAEPLELVNASVDALRAAIDARRLVIEVVQDEAARRQAWLDPTRFQQIVWNLMTNAIKFSKDGGLIRVALLREGDVLTLSVQDYGRGIGADFIAHLFDRFTQSDSPDNRFHGGLGLGLSIVKHLAELHGGGVVARSEGENRGATLEVRLDVAQGEAEGPSTCVAGEEETFTVFSGRPLNGLDVLIVEDNADASEMLTVVLADGGATVRMASDYEDALRAAGLQWPDVLVSDIGLPGRDGYDLVRELRRIAEAQLRPRLYTIALTAFSRPQDKDRALEAGFDVHIGKPLQPHMLMAAIHDLTSPAGRAHAKDG